MNVKNNLDNICLKKNLYGTLAYMLSSDKKCQMGEYLKNSFYIKYGEDD